MRLIKGRVIAPQGGPVQPRDERPAAVVAIGNFDGVHRGHQAVVAAACSEARRRGLLAAALTFEPHPRSFFQPGGEPFRLTLEPLKARRLAAVGLDALYVAPFDAAFAAQSAESFARDALSESLSARHVIVGADFRFGKGREGDLDALRRYGERFGFTVGVMAPVGGPEPAEQDAGGAAVFSSSAVRRALREGDPAEAARILGDWHRIEGAVERGEQRGRELGYPTANQSLEGVLRPAFGVYAVRVEVRTGAHAGAYDGVASLGVRPQFGENVPNFETHLFDFDGDLYRAELSVALVAFLRPEARFESVDALIAQMDRDSLAARRILADAPAR